MMAPDYFQTLARYNSWANTRIYDAVAELPEEAYRALRPAAFFTSLQGTLNHLLLADLIWMARFQGEAFKVTGLDQILHEAFEVLRAAREAEDRRIQAFMDALTPEAIAGNLTFRLIVKPEDMTMPLSLGLAHFFNHQTHHRGQAHALLKEAGVEPPSLDLVLYLH